jgi:hypothetical protein
MPKEKRMTTGETDLAKLLAHMAPELWPGSYLFCTVAADWPGQDGVRPLATFVEKEGLSLVISRDEAEQAGLSGEGAYRCIALTVHSSLEAVGLTAAVATALAGADIPANVIAAYHHDYVFVPAGRAEEALALLQALPRNLY